MYVYTDDTGRVTLIRSVRLSNDDGAIEVDSIPDPETREGHDAILYVTAAEMWYEYRPRPLTIEERVARLEQVVL